VKPIQDVKSQVQEYYDLSGWKRARGNVFEDAERFEDLRPVLDPYRRKCHLRVNRYLEKGSGFLLDVASGPIQYPEYLSYHEGFDTRICADISFQAVEEARNLLGEEGVYVQCDITHLPFAEGSISGIVSLHTIYHVPAEEQANAFLELYRVLVQGKTGVVVYSWGGSATFTKLSEVPLKAIGFVRRVLKGISRRIKRLGRAEQKALTPQQPKYAKLYFHSHTYEWVETHIRARIPMEIFVWRSVSVKMTRTFIHPLLLGRLWLAILYWLEDRFPVWFGKNGVYPLMVIKK
jgi:SAM-dependent methyltransferase